MLFTQYLRRIVLTVVLFFSGTQCFTYSQTITHLKNTEVYTLTSFEYYKTSGCSEKPEEIQLKRFTPYNKKAVHFEFTDATHWLRINVQANEKSEWVLDCGNPLIEKIDVFFLNKNTVSKHLTGGSFVAPAKRNYHTENPNFNFSLEKNTPQTILIRIQSERGFYSKFSLLPLKLFEEKFNKNERSKWIFNGMLMLVDVLLLIISFFLIRKTTFIVFSLHSCLTTIVVLSYHLPFGTSFTQIPEYASLINNLPYRLLPLSCIFVTFHLLPIKSMYPIWVRWFLGINILTAISLIIALIIHYDWLILKLTVENTLVIEFSILGLFIYALIRKIYFDYLIALSFISSFIGFVFLQLRLLQLIDYDWVNLYLNFCEVLKIVLFVFLVYRVILNYEKERVLATKLLLKNSGLNEVTEIEGKKVQIQAIELVTYLQAQSTDFMLHNENVIVELNQNREVYHGFVDEEKLSKIINTLYETNKKKGLETIICNVFYDEKLGIVAIQIESKPPIDINSDKTKTGFYDKQWNDYDEKRLGLFFLKELLASLRAKLEFSEGLLSSQSFKLTIPVSFDYWLEASRLDSQILIIDRQVEVVEDFEQILPQVPTIKVPVAEETKLNKGEILFIQKLDEIIEKRLYDSSFSIGHLAEEMNMSTVQLRRKIKSITNQTTVEYIRNFRLKKAAELLKSGSGNVSDVAFGVGFESLSYFTKVFQEYYGIAPSDYLKQEK
ncbi:helix-turn-helix domain-containing protein [Arcicella rigui]|uniref:Helix-turn-helix domain-containing protein n=1 Tax=Arcicella rigui TaxID=797020 RepID=A0ABU5QDN4_9BACT|nr:helix-turn-helix domain-containing protein [Arcicella rigui]MEA5140858.1 helix-turn-helix domain-containing protein [Arcicella rigui]